MGKRESIGKAPDVLPSEFLTFEWKGLAYCNDLSEVKSRDWLGVGVPLGSRSNCKNAGAMGSRNLTWVESGRGRHDPLVPKYKDSGEDGVQELGELSCRGGFNISFSLIVARKRKTVQTVTYEESSLLFFCCKEIILTLSLEK